VVEDIGRSKAQCNLCRGNDRVCTNSLHELLIGAWQSAFGENKVTYVSGPITTGRLLMDRLRSGTDDPKAVRDSCFEENVATLKGAVRALRERNPEHVFLDPATLNVVGWNQDEYMELWERFIERHANRVILLDGWEYSKGCAREFTRAIEHGVHRETPSGEPIDQDEGLDLLVKAHDDIVNDDANGALSDVAQALAHVINRLRANG
jgi:hypothetical protein